MTSNRGVQAADQVRVDLTAWRLADGGFLMTPHGAPAVVVQLPDFMPATNGAAPAQLPPARKALPAPKRKKRAKLVKRAAKAKPTPAVRNVENGGARPGARDTKRPPDAELERQKRLVEKKGLRAAAEDLGVNYGTLWGRANRYGWAPAPAIRGEVAKPERPRTLGLAAPMATVTTAGPPARVGVRMTVPRRCDECNARTEEDPCHACKAPWKRSR